jgi:hypothetical protein
VEGLGPDDRAWDDFDKEVDRLSPDDDRVDQWMTGCALLVLGLTAFVGLLSLAGYMMWGMGP